MKREVIPTSAGHLSQAFFGYGSVHLTCPAISVGYTSGEFEMSATSQPLVAIIHEDFPLLILLREL